MGENHTDTNMTKGTSKSGSIDKEVCSHFFTIIQNFSVSYDLYAFLLTSKTAE